MTDTILGQVSSGDSRPLLNIPQRLPDEVEIVRRNQDNLSREVRVAIPCQVVSFDATKQTIVAQPLVREKIIDRATGSIDWMTLPQLVDVPVMFPQAGNMVLTMPVTPGDEVTVLFADTCIDAWWFSGGIQNWMDRRRHDLSDGIAILGINSVPNVIQNIATDATELRTKDGAVKVSVKQDNIGTNSLTLTSEGGQVQMQKQSLEGFPTLWDNIKLTANSSKIEMGETIKIEVIDGVPTPVPLDTISLDSPRILINGVDF